jgi:hypothetical protein
LNTHIKGLNDQIEAGATAHPDARRLMTHPGVGPLSALATVLVLGPVTRFPTSKHVVSYVGLAPAIESSAGKHRLGRISKQGNALLRYRSARRVTRRFDAMRNSSGSTTECSSGVAVPVRRSLSRGSSWSASISCSETGSITGRFWIARRRRDERRSQPRPDPAPADESAQGEKSSAACPTSAMVFRTAY